MTKNKKYLPHISLIIPAIYFELIVLGLFIVFLLFLFAVNISYVSKSQSYLHNAAVLSLKNPDNPVGHITLAKFFNDNDLLDSARFEYELAQKIISRRKSNNILGVNDEIKKLTTLIEKNPDLEINQYNYWKNMIIKNKDYEDAYLNLINLSIKLGRKNEAITYLNQLITLNPQSEYVNKFRQSIESM